MNISKNTPQIVYLLVFSLFLGFFGNAHGAVEDTRYLVRSGSGFWKKSFGVRHEFRDGFTTELSDWQLRIAKVFGLEIVPVMKLDILPVDILPELNVSAISVSAQNTIGISSDISVSKGDVILKNDNIYDDQRSKPSPTLSPTPTPTPVLPSRPVPTSQLTWGIKTIYNNDPLLNRTSGGLEVKVAVLDTGVFREHPDLINRISECIDFTQRKQPVVEGTCDDKNGHGTHVAGTILADGGVDGIGIYGIAPEASLMAYKVCGNNGTCWSDDIAFAIKKAADNRVNVLNLSLGGDIESSLIRDAISYAIARNVLVVAAAGNDGDYVGSIDYPAANPNVIAVGAFDSFLDIAEWSSRGINSTTIPYVIEEKDMELAAPGVNIESTWKDGSYVILSGTSMAAPHISGLAAKLWQKDALDPDSATRNLLHTFSDDLLPIGDDDASGFGFSHL